MHSIRANKTWDLVDLPKNRCALPCKWVYILKETSDSTTPTYKVKIVTKGFRQEYGVDFDEIFSPVVPVPVSSATDGHNGISVRLKPDTVQDGFGQPTAVHRQSALALPTRPIRSSVFGSCQLEQNQPVRQPCLYL